MKPDWRNAPTGARWLAQDSDGSWEWHGTKPVVNATGSCSIHSPYKGYWDHKNVPGVWQNAGKDAPNPEWRTTLERRHNPRRMGESLGGGSQGTRREVMNKIGRCLADEVLRIIVETNGNSEDSLQAAARFLDEQVDNVRIESFHQAGAEWLADQYKRNLAIEQEIERRAR